MRKIRASKGEETRERENVHKGMITAKKDYFLEIEIE